MSKEVRIKQRQERKGTFLNSTFLIPHSNSRGFAGPWSGRHEPPRIGRSRHSAPTGAPSRGFTLVEMIVAVGLFSVVMVVSITTLLSLIDANRKAQALQSVMNNLNIALDGMVRSIREGSNYRCGGANPGNPDCPETPGTIFYFTPNCLGGCSDWIYEFRDGRIWRSVDGTIGGEMPLTAPEIRIDSMSMYVIGATRGDRVQPKVVIIVRGSAGFMKEKVRTNFHIQSTAVQRVLDI